MSVYDRHGNALTAVYDRHGNPLETAFNAHGEVIFTNEIVPVDYSNYSMQSLYQVNVSNCQGIAVRRSVLFQFRASGQSLIDKVCLFNLSDGTDIIRDMFIKSDHGDSASFSQEYYDSGDEFPLLYVTADTTPAKIYVNRITRTSATLIKTLTFPQSAGYYGAAAFDWDNNICYLLSYKTSNYTTDEGGSNTTVVSKWDLSNLTDNGDGTYTPAFISQYERAFIYTMQGLAYHDGYIWIASGNTGRTSYIYAMNPSTGVIVHTITMDNIEVEGMDFVYDPVSHSYFMVTGQQNGYYKKYTFAPVVN